MLGIPILGRVCANDVIGNTAAAGIPTNPEAQNGKSRRQKKSTLQQKKQPGKNEERKQNSTHTKKKRNTSHEKKNQTNQNYLGPPRPSRSHEAKAQSQAGFIRHPFIGRGREASGPCRAICGGGAQQTGSLEEEAAALTGCRLARALHCWTSPTHRISAPLVLSRSGGVAACCSFISVLLSASPADQPGLAPRNGGVAPFVLRTILCGYGLAANCAPSGLARRRIIRWTWPQSQSLERARSAASFTCTAGPAPEQCPIVGAGYSSRGAGPLAQTLPRGQTLASSHRLNAHQDCCSASLHGAWLPGSRGPEAHTACPYYGRRLSVQALKLRWYQPVSLPNESLCPQRSAPVLAGRPSSSRGDHELGTP